MKLQDYISTLKHPLHPRTLVFLIKDHQVLLGLKKTGFGKGYWLGIGGKVEEGESIEAAAIREAQEEIGVDIGDLQNVGVVNFYFPHIKDESWNQQVHVFLSRAWEGLPIETTEIGPQWFDMDQIPFDEMWDDAHYWLSGVLEGKTITGNFMFDSSNSKVEEEFIES